MKVKGYFERMIDYIPEYEPTEEDYEENIYYWECHNCESKKIMHSFDTRYCMDCLSIDIWCRKVGDDK